MMRISSPADPTAQMFKRQTNTLSRQFWMLTDSLSLKENITAQITLTCPCISSSFITVTIRIQNRSDPQIITLKNHINEQIHEHRTNTWKQHFDKIDHKHNPHSLWGTIANLCNKKQPTQQNRSIRLGTRTAITDTYSYKAKAFKNNSQTSLHIAQTKSTGT